LLGDRGHDVEQVRVAFAGRPGAVFLQATDHVVGLLAADVRVGRARDAGAGGAVAGHAGRDAALGVAAAEQALADLVELHALVRARGDDRVVGDAGAGRLGGVVRADVTHVLGAEHGRERDHDRGHAGGAFAALEQRQLAGDIALALPGHARIHRVGRVAVDAVAGRAHGGLLRAGLRI